MVSLRLFSLLLLFFFINPRFSFAHPHQDGKGAEGNDVSTREGIQDDRNKIVATAAWNSRFRGRKTMVSRLQKVNTKVGSAATSTEKGCLNLEDGKSGRADLNDSEGGDGSGFVAFNADYHPPRHHPPKNN